MAIAAATLFNLQTNAAELANTVVVARTGDSQPGGVGVLTEPEPPILGNGGSAVFAANIRENNVRIGSGLFIGDGSDLAFVVKEGDSTPNLDGEFGAFTGLVSTPRINSLNQVAFRSFVANSTIQGGSQAIFVADHPAGQVRQIARSTLPTPSGSGTYENAVFASHYSFNDAGQIAIVHRALFTGSFNFQHALFRLNGTPAGDAEIVVPGQPAPEGNDTFTFVFTPSINASGHVMFVASTTQQTPGILVENGGSIHYLLRVGQPTPSGNGTYSALTASVNSSLITFNDSGQAAAVIDLAGTTGGTSDNEGLYRVDGTGAVEIVRKGDPAPDGNGTFLNVTGRQHALNNAGQVLFPASIAGATGLATSGLFIGDGATLTQILRRGDAAPGGGTFSSLPVSNGEIALNGAGQAVFLASVQGSDGFTRPGLFFFDPVAGLSSVARYGDTLLGVGDVTGITFSGGTGTRGRENSGLNDLGQVAYHVFAGTERAVAIWSAPRSEPALPELRAGMTETGEFRLTWPQDGSTWILRSADDVTANDWNVVPIEPVDQEGTHWSVNLPLDEGSQFFLLRESSEE